MAALAMVRTGNGVPTAHATLRRQGRNVLRVPQYPDATLNVLRELLADESGVPVSETTMRRQLVRMGLTPKKRPSARTRGTVLT